MRTLHVTILLALLFGCAAKSQHIIEVRPAISGLAGELRFVETDGVAGGTATNYVGFKTPAAITTNLVWTLPATDGTSGQALVTDGAGVLSWGAGGGSAGYSFLKDYTVSLTQRDTLHFVTQAFNCYDDSVDGGDGDGLETECALDTSPVDSAVVVGTGRTMTGTAPVRVSGVSGTPITLGGDLVFSMAISPGAATTAVGTSRAVTSSGPITVNGGTSTSLAVDLAIGCASCASLSTNQQWTATQNFQDRLNLGGATGSTQGELYLYDPDGVNLASVRTFNFSGSTDVGEVAVHTDGGGTSTYLLKDQVFVDATGTSFDATFSGTGIQGGGGSWGYTNAGITVGSNTFLTSARWVYGVQYLANGVLGTSNTLACSGGQAVTAITVNAGIVTAVSCGTP